MIKFRSSASELRHKVFVEVAKAAFGSEDVVNDLESIPYKLTPTEKPRYRESIYRERAIASERVRLALGMSLNPQDQPSHLTSGFDKSNISEKYYEPPLMQVIPSACDCCEDDKYEVSNQCRKCISRYCVHACPVNAVSVGEDGHAVIDEKRCVRCGRCKSACPYEAIVHKIRPCAENCGVHAISSDKLGRAYIDPQKCVACGQCMVHCPFGAIADKSQIFQLINAIKAGEEIVGEVAPSVVGQFGEDVSLGQIVTALKKLGFSEVREVAKGADHGATAEAKKYVEKIASGEHPFMLTSCCPSYIMLAEREFPALADGISETLTPMVTTARTIKQDKPNAKVVFIGPCAAKKLEAMRESVRSDVDFVITFEELSAIFDARGICPESCEDSPVDGATAAGRGYGASGGVSRAIEACIHAYYPETEIKSDHAEGLFECRKMLRLAKFGKREGYLLEGMGCPGGCVGGAGINVPVGKGTEAVRQFSEETQKKVPEKDLYTRKLP